MPSLFAEFGHETWLPFPAIAARLVLAALLGAIIGFEREWRQRPAGLRTHMLVCLAAALIAIVTIEITHVAYFQDDSVQVDPIRLVEAVTAGVAFLAAGLIIFAKGEVHGLTTGAGMWLASAIGLCCGLGFWQIGLFGTALAVVVLGLLQQVSDRIAPGARDKAQGETPAGCD
ncbi:MAG: MgtC/SapB family protein [Mesorhizobium sp.]|nr:MgtC/SapB family protein [Mesorhizobium sp.]